MGHATAEGLLDPCRECPVSLVAEWSHDDDPRVNDAIAWLAPRLALPGFVS